MEIAVLIVTLAGVAITGVAAVAAVVQARAATAAKEAAEDARNESRLAKDEAVRLSEEANAAFVRQAAAQEEANRLAKAAAPKREPKIELHQISETRWRATNTGNLPAASALVTGISGMVDVDDIEPRSLHVGDSLYFDSINTFASQNARIEVSLEWVDEDGETMTAVNKITLP